MCAGLFGVDFMTFLRAEWRDLVMINWEINPELLKPYLPAGTELDLWQGKAFVSLVAFRFLNTRVLNLAIPFHINFEEINLRFYVKKKFGNEIRRGVVFIKEIVPRACIAFVARTLYNENYVTAKMSHKIEPQEGGTLLVQYDWLINSTENQISLVANAEFEQMLAGSFEEFIAEHYWGYSVQRDGSTLEYQVTHPRWRVSRVREFLLKCDVVGLYGEELGAVLLGRPEGVFLAQGSGVEVGFGRRE